MKEKFLPIGSVVLLKGATKEVMITCYSIFGNSTSPTENSEPEKRMYEYGCCVYPEGILNASLIGGFNHDQIEKILFVGYETDKQKDLSEFLKSNYDTIKDAYEKGEVESA